MELAPVGDSAAVPNVVAAALGFRQSPGRPPLASVVDGLRRGRLLLVIDNCEHVIDAAADLCASILGACPGVRIVATSRQALRIDGETVFLVTPLALSAGNAPEARAGESRAAPDRSEAERLFLARAEAVLPGFAPAAAEVAAIRRICHQWFFWMHGLHSEGSHWLEAGLAAGDSAPVEMRLRTLLAAGIVIHGGGDYDRVAAHFKAALALARERGDTHAQALTLIGMGTLDSYRGEAVRSEALLNEGIALARLIGEAWTIAWGLANLGRTLHLLGRQGGARDVLAEALRLTKAAGDRWNAGHIEYLLGRVALETGDVRGAAAHLVHCLHLAAELGDTWRASLALAAVAHLALAVGRATDGTRLLGAAASAHDATGGSWPPMYQQAFQHDVEGARRLLGDRFGAAWEAGQTAHWQAAIALAQTLVAGRAGSD